MISRFALIWFALAASSAPAAAHGFTVEATSRGGDLRVVAGYDTGEPAEGAAVTVTAESGEVVALGMTDARGVWSGPLPPPGEYRVRADDGAGHGGRIAIVVTATGEVPPAPEPWPRWAQIAIGLLVIAALTALARRLARARVAGDPPPTGPRPPRPSGGVAE